MFARFGGGVEEGRRKLQPVLCAACARTRKHLEIVSIGSDLKIEIIIEHSGFSPSASGVRPPLFSSGNENQQGLV
jgi:hypothetical protein